MRHWFDITLAGLMIACVVLLIVLLLVVVLVACCDHSCYTSQGVIATRGSASSINHTPLLVKGQDVEMQTVGASRSQRKPPVVIAPPPVPPPIPDPVDLSRIRFHPPARLDDDDYDVDPPSFENGAGEEEKQSDPMHMKSSQPIATSAGGAVSPGKPLSSVVVLEQSTDSDEETV